MTDPHYAVSFLASLWGQQESAVADEVGDILASWQRYLKEDPSRALAGDLPYRAELAAIISSGILDSAGGVLAVSAREAGLTRADPGFFAVLGDYYAQVGPMLADSVAAAAQGSAHRALTAGIRAGLGERDLAARVLAQVVPASQARLRTVARTELTNAATLSRAAIFAGAGVTRFGFNAVLDDRTTRVCTCADGFVLDLTRALHRELAPACHFRCRSLIVPADTSEQTTPDALVREALALREADFPGWIPRLSPFLAQSFGG